MLAHKLPESSNSKNNYSSDYRRSNNFNDHEIDNTYNAKETQQHSVSLSWKHKTFNLMCFAYGIMGVLGCYFVFTSELPTAFTNLMNTSGLVSIMIAVFFNLFAALTPTYKISKAIKITFLSILCGFMFNGFLSGVEHFGRLEGNIIYYVIAIIIPFLLLCKSSGYSLFSQRVFVE